MSRHTDRHPDPDALFDEYRQTGDVEIRNRLVVEHTWLADRCARRFAHRGEPYADLQQIARLGLVKAVERYRPERGVPFQTFALPTITGEIKRYFRDRTWAVSVPRSAKDVRTLVSTAFEKLEQDLERAPTTDEVASYSGVRPALVDSALHANRAYRTSSLDALERPDQSAPHAETEEQELVIAARDALARLDHRKRTVLFLRFYEDRTQREIGETVGVGQVQVSRLIRAAIDELRAHLTTVDPAVPAAA